jgi:hypothetical protein
MMDGSGLWRKNPPISFSKLSKECRKDERGFCLQRIPGSDIWLNVVSIFGKLKDKANNLNSKKGTFREFAIPIDKIFKENFL